MKLRNFVFILILLHCFPPVLYPYTIRVVPYSPGVTLSDLNTLSSKITSVTLRYYRNRPNGLKKLELLYNRIRKNFISLNYNKVRNDCTSLLHTVTPELDKVVKWDLLHRALRFCTMTAFGMREYPLLDQIIWAVVRWFPDDQFSGKKIPPDLRLRWEKIRGEVSFFTITFSIPVSGVTLKVDGRYIRGRSVKIPQGPHQIYWYTPYESDVMVKDIYAPEEIKLPVYPVDMTLLRSRVVEKGWCSRELEKLFAYYTGESPVLFFSTTDPDKYVLADPATKGIIIKGGEGILGKLNEVLSGMNSIEYVPPVYCSWKRPPFYRTWWFYLGTSLFVGGSAYGGYILYRKHLLDNTGVVVSW